MSRKCECVWPIEMYNQFRLTNASPEYVGAGLVDLQQQLFHTLLSINIPIHVDDRVLSGALMVGIVAERRGT